MTKTCYYCLSVDHDDVIGVTSVVPKFEGRWFCSTNCLCEHKISGLRVNKSKKTKKKKTH